MDQSDTRLERLGKERESKRRFLPIFREEMTEDESLGRLTLMLHAALHDEGVRRYGKGKSCNNWIKMS